MASKELFDALKALFENAGKNKPLPMVVQAETATANAQAKAKERGRKVEPKKAPDGAPQTKGETQPKVQDTEVVRKAMIRAGQEAGSPLSAEQKMTVLVSDQFRASVPIDNQRLLGGISRLSPNKQPPEINWSTPSAEEWAKVRTILKDMPQMTTLSESDQMVLREVRQAAYEWGYRNWDAIKGSSGKRFDEVVKNDPAFKGASAERITKDEQAVYYHAHSAHPENTQAWAEDLETQILDDFKLGPEITRTVEPAEANRKIKEAIRMTDELSWLVSDGELIKDPDIAQVVYDIVQAGEDAWTKEFLLAKGSQIKALGQGSTDEQVRERDTFRKRFAEKVAQMYHDEVSPEFGDRAEDALEAIGTAGTSRGRGRARGARRRAPGGDEFSAGALRYLDKVAGPRAIPAERVAARNLKSRLEHFNKILHDAHGNMNDPRVRNEIFDFMTAMQDHNTDSYTWRRLMADQPELAQKYETFRETALSVGRERYTERELERGWSSLYLSLEEMKRSWRGVDVFARSKQDFINATVNVFEGKWEEAADRNYSQLIQYAASDDYRKNRLAYLRDPRNWDEITQISGESIYQVRPDGSPVLDSDGNRVLNTNHKWYREMNEGYLEWNKEVSRTISIRGALLRLKGGLELDTEMDKLKSVYAIFGDEGYPRTLNERNGLNLEVFGVFKQRFAAEIWDENGYIRALTAGRIEVMEDAIVDQMWAHAQKGMYNDRFQEWEGSVEYDTNGDVRKDKNGRIIRRRIEKTDIEMAVREVSMLIEATGQRAQIFGKAATPIEMMHQSGNPLEFGGQPAEGKIIFSMNPFKWLVDRWAIKSDFGALVMRKMFAVEASRVGLDTYWRARLSQLDKIRNLPTPEGRAAQAEWNRLVKMAFNINDLDDQATVARAFGSLRIRREDSFLRQLFGGTREGLQRQTPQTLSELTKADLEEQIIYREGRRLLDARFSGAYHYIDSGWQIGSQIDALKDFGLYKVVDADTGMTNGVLLHETARLDAGGLFDTAGDHKKFHDAEVTLKTKTFVLMGKFDPIASIDALAQKMHEKTFGWFSTNSALFSRFHDAAMGENLVYNANNPEQFVRGAIKAAGMRRAMVDTELALAREWSGGKLIETPQGPIDYSKWNGDMSVYSLHEQAALKKVCVATGDSSLTPEENVKAYLDVMKAASDFALNPHIIEDLANPAYAAHFTTVNTIDPRIKFLDGIKDNNPDHQRKELKWSGRISSVRGGHGAGGGLPRWAGDTQNSVNAMSKDLIGILGAKDGKTFMQHFKPFVDTILFSGGYEGAKAPVGQTLFYGWRQAVVKDLWADLSGISDDRTTMDLSAAQRAVGQGAPAMGRVDLDHLEHEVEAALETKFHTHMPDFTHKMHRKFGIQIAGFKTVRLYNAYAFVLIGGALLAMGAFGSAKKGVQDASGAGGGGGHS